MEDLSHDLEIVERVGAEIGLQLNTGKSEIISTCPATIISILSSLPGAKVVHPN